MRKQRQLTNHTPLSRNDKWELPTDITRHLFSLAILPLWLLFLTGDAAAGAPAAPAPRHPFDAVDAMDKAEATRDARIERAGSAWRVHVSRSSDRPGITFRPPAGSRDVTGHEFVEARVKNVGKRPLALHMALDKANANRTERKGCCIGSTNIPPGEQRHLRVLIAARPPGELEAAFRGMRGTPGGFQTRPGHSIDPTNVVGITVFPGNELNWGANETSLARAVLASPADQPAKRALVGDLRAKYDQISKLNAAWRTTYTSWDNLLESTTPPGPDQGRDDLAAFLGRLADAYFRQCREAVKETDPEGLYLGCRFAGWSHGIVFRTAAKYSDVISVNRYTKTLTDLRLPDGIDKPVLIGEWHFGALDRGKFHASLRPVANQQARGEAYEKYVASALENPLVVGTHWHQFGDQATTGRDDGENFQNGFVDVCDTPYAETIAASRRIGYRMYELRAGRP